MSEPTYRVELTHHPENGLAVEWRAAIYPVAEGHDEHGLSLFDAFRSTREDAFDAAQAWCKAKAQEPHAPSTVLLDEDGEIHDRHDQQRKCERCNGFGQVRDPLYTDPVECGACSGTGVAA